MYHDIITDINIPGFNILINSKKEFVYNAVLNEAYSILMNNNNYQLELKAIVSDREFALIKSVKKFSK